MNKVFNLARSDFYMRTIISMVGYYSNWGAVHERRPHKIAKNGLPVRADTP